MLLGPCVPRARELLARTPGRSSRREGRRAGVGEGGEGAQRQRAAQEGLAQGAAQGPGQGREAGGCLDLAQLLRKAGLRALLDARIGAPAAIFCCDRRDPSGQISARKNSRAYVE